MVQGRLEISPRKNPLEVYRKSTRVPPVDSAGKNPLEVSRKSARVAPYTTYGIMQCKLYYFTEAVCIRQIAVYYASTSNTYASWYDCKHDNLSPGSKLLRHGQLKNRFVVHKTLGKY